MKHLNSITIKQVLPVVFADERPLHADSEIWLRENIELQRPGRWIIRAASGTGKSSLCSFLYGNRSDYNGLILFNDRDIKELSIAEWCDIRQRSLSRLPQEMQLFPELTAMENILLKNSLTDYKTEAEIKQMIDSLDIGECTDRKAGKLSVGQQQRVAIIRSLCQPFDFLLLDEPVSHLDEKANKAVAALVETECTLQHAGLIVTSVGNDLAITSPTIIRL